MIAVLLLFLSVLSWGAPPAHWSALIEIQDRHEFYQDNEVIAKPKDSWQTLFGVVFPDRDLKLHKDCVYYRVPGAGPGVLKVKGVPVSDGCEKYIDGKGEIEVSGLRALQFSFGPELVLHFTFSDFKTLKWSVPLSNHFKAPYSLVPHAPPASGRIFEATYLLTTILWAMRTPIGHLIPTFRASLASGRPQLLTFI